MIKNYFSQLLDNIEKARYIKRLFKDDQFLINNINIINNFNKY